MFGSGLTNSILTHIETRCGRTYYPESYRFDKLPAGRQHHRTKTHPTTPCTLAHCYTSPDTIPEHCLPYHTDHIYSDENILLGQWIPPTYLSRQFLQSWHKPVLFFLFHYFPTGTPCFSSLLKRPIPILSLSVIFFPPI